MNTAELIATTNHSLNNALCLLYMVAKRLDSCPDPEASKALHTAIRKSRGVTSAFSLLTVIAEPEASTGFSEVTVVRQTLRDWLVSDPVETTKCGTLAVDEELLKPLIGCAIDALGARLRTTETLQTRLSSCAQGRMRIEIAKLGHSTPESVATGDQSPGELALRLAYEQLEQIGITIDPSPPCRIDKQIVIEIPCKIQP